jgi:hypothetical protein
MTGNIGKTTDDELLIKLNFKNEFIDLKKLSYNLEIISLYAELYIAEA